MSINMSPVVYRVRVTELILLYVYTLYAAAA